MPQTGAGANAQGNARGAPFSARLVLVFGMDTSVASGKAIFGIDRPLSSRMAAFEMADGCRHTFRADSLSSADVRIIDAMQAAHPLTPDPNIYAESDKQYLDPATMATKATRATRYDTQHSPSGMARPPKASRSSGLPGRTSPSPTSSGRPATGWSGNGCGSMS